MARITEKSIRRCRVQFLPRHDLYERYETAVTRAAEVALRSAAPTADRKSVV